jgi:DNA-directed RNA polymerase II subunit RPB2
MTSNSIETDIITWNIIDKYFKDNPNFLTRHHLDSYNDFVKNGIPRIFKDNNPIQIMKEQDEKTKEFKLQCKLYLGGKNGDKIYYGKPTIYEENGRKHFMFPNEARLRNMNYAFSVHYDVEVEMSIMGEDGTIDESSFTIDKQYLGRFPIMIQSDLCILNGMSNEARFNMGECKNDQGGYFIIDGKEKVIVSQERFASNTLNIKDSVNDVYSHAAEIRTQSEDPSKPVRTLSVKIVAPTPTQKNGQIVVDVPNVRKPLPLFILMRALGIESDKDIIEMCLLNLKEQSNFVDLFIPSVYDAGEIFTQEAALQYIATFTKHKTIPSVMHILMDYFLPNIGELNFRQKAYYLGYMVKRMLNVYLKYENPTDRDSYKYKRVELSGTLMYDLFLEYYKLQLRDIFVKIDSKYYYNVGIYSSNFRSLITDNYPEFFKNRIVEDGVKKGFKGNWGAQEYTKKLGVVQDLNRLSFFSFVSHLRKLNLPMDSTAKIVGPRLLHSTQWGVVCPVETPDGGNVGLHKHMAITTHVTSGCSMMPTLEWLKQYGIRTIGELSPQELYGSTKVFVNGSWNGIIYDPVDLIQEYKLQRRNGIIPVYNSIHWDIAKNEIHIYTDSGRLCRPIIYTSNHRVNYERSEIKPLIMDKNKFTWEKLVSGFYTKPDEYSIDSCKTYNIDRVLSATDRSNKREILEKNASILEYVDTNESEGLYVHMEHKVTNKYITHVEIHPSLILSVMGNMVIFPENNQLPRDLFSCGQSKQAVSIYNTNFQNRIDKMGVVLNSGQIPLVKSRYLDYVTKEQHPYGENAIVAIMCYNGYNVEDALIFNESALKRGLFRTTYYNMYEAHEESNKNKRSMTSRRFSNINSENVIGKKPGYDYNYLDENGLIKENTLMNDKITVIGKVIQSTDNMESFTDESVYPKKGQLGYVDKAFITEQEEGERIAKVRIREERVPSIGDKFCSRAGQKGTVGIVLPERDMPFMSDGTRPDLIVNPHALPSRMTIGQLIECLMGKACVQYGAFGDCTAFTNKGPKTELFGKMLTKQGFHKSGNEFLHNGMTGELMESEIFMGPTYYLRLKHMVKDKINYRARGPRVQLTRQTIGGRAKDGGLRVGEMERDTLIAHGITYFLQQSMLDRGDDYYMAVCNKTGAIAIYNENKNIFLSPFADGPIQFSGSLDGNMNIVNISKYGRDFSVVRVPYTFKLLLQELQAMNVQMRIITEANVDQLTSLTYSKRQLELNTGHDSYQELIEDYKKLGMEQRDRGTRKRDTKKQFSYIPPPTDDIPQPSQYVYGNETPPYMGSTSPAYIPVSPTYSPTSPPYQPGGVGYADSPVGFETMKAGPERISPEFKNVRSLIVIPFRDQPKLHGIQGQDRREHKKQFMNHMRTFIPKLIEYAQSNGINYNVNVIFAIQTNDGEKFNRGQLLNAGFLYASQFEAFDNVIFHDVDLLPGDELIPYYVNPLDGKHKVRHLAHSWGRYSDSGFGYIGGITMFDSLYFYQINGFPNYFKGWGGEDDAIRNRIMYYSKLANNMDAMREIVEYPEVNPQSITDLEGITEFGKKKDILSKDDELYNMLKREGLRLDEKLYKLNGLRNTFDEGGVIDAIKSDDDLGGFQDLVLQLNNRVSNLKLYEEKYGTMTPEQLQKVNLSYNVILLPGGTVPTLESLTVSYGVPFFKNVTIQQYSKSPGYTPPGQPESPPYIPPGQMDTITPQYTPPGQPESPPYIPPGQMDTTTPKYTPPKYYDDRPYSSGWVTPGYEVDSPAFGIASETPESPPELIQSAKPPSTIQDVTQAIKPVGDMKLFQIDKPENESESSDGKTDNSISSGSSNEGSTSSSDDSEIDLSTIKKIT